MQIRTRDVDLGVDLRADLRVDLGDPSPNDTRLAETDPARDWRTRAECVHWADQVEFFPARGESTREAKAVCSQCPVRLDCLEYALQWDHLSGVWGGMSERERRQIRRRRNRGGATAAEVRP